VPTHASIVRGIAGVGEFGEFGEYFSNFQVNWLHGDVFFTFLYFKN